MTQPSPIKPAVDFDPARTNLFVRPAFEALSSHESVVGIHALHAPLQSRRLQLYFPQHPSTCPSRAATCAVLSHTSKGFLSDNRLRHIATCPATRD